MALIALAALAPLSAIGYGLTYIKDKLPDFVTQLPGGVRKIVKTVKTNMIARIFAGIFTLGLTELMKHEKKEVEYKIEDTFLGANEVEAAKKLNDMGNELYKKGNYKASLSYFEKASGLNDCEEYKENQNKAREKIEAARRQQEETERLAKENVQLEKIEAARRQQEETERLAKENAQLEKAKVPLEEAIRMHREAELMDSEELKFRMYATVIDKCKEACFLGTSEAIFDALNNTFESCWKYGAYDEAGGVREVVKKYFPNKVDRLQKASNHQEEDLWIPGCQSGMQSTAEEAQNRSIVMVASPL